MMSLEPIVSSDHAGAELDVSHLATTAGPRSIAAEEVQRHDGRDGSAFWAVIDGFVVDASAFLKTHPGGLQKLLAADHAATGATGKEFGFSFSRGRNAHFPDTGKRFAAGVKRFLAGKGATVDFPSHGALVIVGKLA